MKPIALALMATLMLAGCGQTSVLAPQNNAGSKSGPMAARANTSTKSAIVRVPAGVMANMEDHYAQLQQKYNAPGQTLSAVVVLVASNDNFKRVRHEAKLPAADLTKAPGTAHDFVVGMLNGGVTPGKYEYYLVMKAVVFTQGKNRLEAEELEDFYVSDFGRNYPVTLQ